MSRRFTESASCASGRDATRRRGGLFRGVDLVEIIKRAGAPLGERLRGPTCATHFSWCSPLDQMRSVSSTSSRERPSRTPLKEREMRSRLRASWWWIMRWLGRRVSPPARSGFAGAAHEERVVNVLVEGRQLLAGMLFIRVKDRLAPARRRKPQRRSRAEPRRATRPSGQRRPHSSHRPESRQALATDQ